MDLSFSPGKILLRLEELRKWQKIQEERLHQQQMLERQNLIAEQELLTESLSLSCNIGLEESSNELIAKFENTSEELMNGNRGISQNDESKNEQIPFEPSYSNYKLQDGIISKSNQKVDCHSKDKCEERSINQSIEKSNLICEKSKNSNNADFMDDEQTKARPTTAKKYLRRGEGLLRFRMSREDAIKKVKMPWLKDKNKRNAKAITIATNTDSKNNSGSKSKKKLCFKIDPKTSFNENVSEIVENEESHKLNEAKDMALSQNYFSENQDGKELINPSDSIKLNEMVNFQCNYKSLLEKKPILDSSLIESLLLTEMSVEKEKAEQDMFELIEKKVDDNSFSSTSSIYKKVFDFSNNTHDENRQYLKTHPQLFKLLPNPSEFDFQESVNVMTANFKNCAKYNEDEGVCQNNCISDDNCSDRKSSESSDTEETCRLALKDVPTSTPNNTKPEKLNENSAASSSEENKRNNNKIIKIVIKGDDSEKLGSFYLDADDTLTPNKNCSIEEFSKIENKTKTNDHSNVERMDMISMEKVFRKRLQELEAEINTFNSENARLNKLKEELSIEKEKFLCEKASIERKLNEDKIIAEYHLAEEKEKLLKLKLLYDRNSKEMKLQNSKKDRDEISKLKTEVSNLKEQIALKDSRNGAAQARLRNQIRILEEKNVELKEECEKLKKENRKIKNFNIRSQRLTNIKMLADITKSITNNVNTEDDVNSHKAVSNESLTDLPSVKSLTKQTKRQSNVHRSNMRSRTKSAPNLSVTSKYTKFFSERDKEIKERSNDKICCRFESSDDSDHSIDADKYMPQLAKNNSVNKSPDAEKITADSDIYTSDKNMNIDNIYSPEFCVQTNDYSKKMESNLPEMKSMADDQLKTCIKEQFNEKPNLPPQNYSKSKYDLNKLCLSESAQYAASNTVNRIENVKSDGSLEVKFSNGNIKIVTADGSYSKFTFYNGDIKETFFNDGLIKYFYNELKIYHTTYKDGTEVLEFPDGYIERRYKDGSVQAHLPNGVTRWMKPDSDEEWRFPDGTVVLVNSSGDQTLRFPNGQIEIHTKEYRKRIFPDGTSRIVYADGVIETRYANGRIRVKDKEGNLVMDSMNRNNFNM